MVVESRVRRAVSTAASATLVVCAVAVTSLLFYRELNPVGASPTPRQLESQPDWRDYAVGGHRIGPPGAPIVFVVFMDYQCPSCLQLETMLRKTQQKYAGQVVVVYRNYPLAAIHPFAQGAALASECAAQQGRFEAMHQVLFAHHDSLGVLGWPRTAELAGLPDLKLFTQCVADSATVAAVNRDRDAGKRLKVRGTPTVLVNGVRFLGTLREDALDSLTKAAIRDAHLSSPR